MPIARRRRIVLCALLVLGAVTFGGGGPVASAASGQPRPLSDGPEYNRVGGASGSGCSPGAGSTLPAGWWAGEITSVYGATVQFNVVCWYAGAAAIRAAAADDQPPPPNDYYVRDASQRLRTVTFASSGTPATCVGQANQPFACTVGDVLTLYPGPDSTLTIDRREAFGFPIVWIHSAGPIADHAYMQFMP